eukprot:TRINITY_DN6169_c0_g1_i1.p1 TRINITY_DN6169_c0_g1~~TRINITY_DN6169_c0_g1_i1.p1  ORF type:complete len:500 (+),score=196.95 TRINITY_DN6169_c0_g1_i1:95-1501(+)
MDPPPPPDGVDENAPEDTLREQLKRRLDQARELKVRLVAQAGEIAKEKAALLTQIELEVRAIIRERLRDFAEKRLEQGLDDLRFVVANSLKDPYMPLRVQKAVDEIVEAVWPDVKDEVRVAVMSLVVRSPAPRPASEPPICCAGSCCAPCTPCGRLLACWRYFLYPYDKSWWHQMHNPLFVLWTLMSLIPVYGIPQAVYLIILIVIDREDEFSLVTFILYFKATLFLTLGILGSAVASIQLYICIMDIDGKREDENCADTAPQEPFYLIALFVLQVVMVWCAFLLLPASKRKGGQHYRQELEIQQAEAEAEQLHPAVAKLREKRKTEFRAMRDSDEREREQQVRGRLRYWLLYELGLFFVCVLILLLVFFVGANDESARVTTDFDNWRLQTTIYMVKCFYGLMSLPFIVLMLPAVSTLITHARPTGYTENGECVPFAPVKTRPDSGTRKGEEDKWAQKAPQPAGAAPS